MDKIELEKIFSIAVGREVEAHEFYKEVEKRVDDESVKAVFKQLAREELEHMELLEKLKADPSMPMKFETPPKDFKVADATDLPELGIDMKPADAIALAMKKEQQAMDFYRTLADAAGEAELKNIFRSLADMELGHKQRLENVFVEIGYPETF